MATKAKDNALEKEKRPKPSSNSRTAANKQPTATTRSTDKDKSVSPSSGKSVPNYLKHTFISSRSESLKLGKKTANEDSTQKLLRRRSFDRPPSALHVQKSLVSPDPKQRVASPDRLVRNPSPSPSPLSRARIHDKPILERKSKSLKPLRPQPQQPAATIRSKSPSKNADSSKSSNGSTIPLPDISEDQLDVETKAHTNDKSLVQEVEETFNVNRDDVTQVENNYEHSNAVTDSQVKLDGNEDEKVKTDDIIVVPEVPHLEVEVEETKSDETLHQDKGGNRHEGDDREKEEMNGNKPEESSIVDGSKVVRSEDKEEEAENEGVNCHEQVVEEAKNEESEELKAGEEMVKKQGKKESPTAYNDVIEETKNKLLEKRKNKVKALVGAFETVIDYEAVAGSHK